MPNPPKPTALKVLNGSAAHHPERRNGAEPKPAPVSGVPEPPAWMPLGETARRAWDALAAEASRMLVLTEADLAALALTCRALADHESARSDEDGWRRSDAAWKRAMAGLREFGLTPSARVRVRASDPAADDPLDALLRKAGSG